MDARKIIAKLRKGQTPDADELRWFANGLADMTVSDAQAGAFAMAVCLNGLGSQGRADLTLAMRDTGSVLEWNLDGPVVDKHSTGGVGDCLSLVLAPALAACGVYVPMISGRGLGHTGGTLDKLEAIPGVSTSAGDGRLLQITRTAGCAIVGASAEIAPADRRLYAIRDVTSTVDSLDLITASILSKKLAAAPDALVLDVKVGSGAFMKTEQEAQALATALTETANTAGCPTTAIITDMNQPLAPALGNALEIAETMRVLTGEQAGPMVELAAALGGVVLTDAKAAIDVQDGANRVYAAIRDGKAAECFGRMIAAQGGPLSFVEDWSRFLPEANVIREVRAPRDGYITSIEGEALGLAVVQLGGGRQVETDSVDPSVGLSGLVRIGDQISAGQPLGFVHAVREDAARIAERAVVAAISIGPEPTEPPALFKERIG